MIELDEAVVVARPRAAVADLLVRIDDLPSWLPAVRDARLLDPPPARSGSRIALTLHGPSGPLSADGQITELRPDRLAFRTLQAPAELEASCDLEPIDQDQTRLRVRARIKLPGMLRFAEGIVRQRIEKERATAMASLVRRLESAIPA